MQNVIQFLENNQEKNLNQLFEFLAIPSISTDPSYDSETKKCAEWLAENMNKSGIKTRIIETKSKPLVYGEILDAGENSPTLLIYGHYDVQPVDPLDLWDTPPFEPQVRDGKIYGRGTADDKGQIFTHIKAIEAYLQTVGKLPINVKLLIEGEEESGGEAIAEFLPKNTDLLKCDCVLITDTSWITPNHPSITYGLRGICAFELTLTGPNRDLHSGTYGGAVDNPIHVLTDVISRMHDKYGKVAIPGFYDGVSELSAEEKLEFANLPSDDQYLKNDLEVDELYGENGFSTLERKWSRPTFEVNGISGGYFGAGHKSIVPSKANAKFSMRLVPGQDWESIGKLAQDYIKTLIPKTVKAEFSTAHGGNPVVAPHDSKGVLAARIALEKAFNKKSILMREGGSIPIIADFQNLLGVPAVMMGLGLDSDNIHSPNENFVLEHYYGGIKAVAYFLEEFSK